MSEALMSEALSSSEALPSEIMSFGNIVNSLRSVRNDYNEHLKTVPQYGAFLLVESSTQHVADTLRSIIAPSSKAGEVIEALETAKSKFREHLGSVPEYRALLAIDKLISDVAADLGVQPKATPVAEPEPAVPDLPAVLVETILPAEATLQTDVAAQADPAAQADEPVRESQPVEAIAPVEAMTPVTSTAVEMVAPLEAAAEGCDAAVAAITAEHEPEAAAPAESVAVESTAVESVATESPATETVAAEPVTPEPVATEFAAAIAEQVEPERPLAYEPPSMVSADYGAVTGVVAEATPEPDPVVSRIAEPHVSELPATEQHMTGYQDEVPQPLSEPPPAHHESFEHGAEKAA